MTLEVIRPGALSLLQDAGRFGYQHLGIGTGGPMDEHAFHWANYLLGNPADASQIEISMGGFQVKFHLAASIAVTGADMAMTLDGDAVTPWRTLAVKPGQQLDFHAPQNGLRAYLAVRGGLQAPLKLGSCATVMREQLGGLDGQGSRLRAGDLIEFNPDQTYTEQHTPAWAIPNYQAPLHLGVLPTYQHKQFSRKAIATLFGQPYQVSPQIDRMGYRLTGPVIKNQVPSPISEGIVFGAIQVPGDGQPIILMKDHQTIGGYPKIGCISALAAGQLAQRVPGSTVHFHPLSIEDASRERRLFIPVSNATRAP